MRIDFHRIDQPAEALFAPGADLITLPLAVSLLENRRQSATVRTVVDDEPLEYTIRGDSYDITADFGDGPVTLVSESGPHFRRTLTGPDLRLDIHPSEEREEIRGVAGTVSVDLRAGPEERIYGTLGGESFEATIATLEDGTLAVQGRLGELELSECIAPTDEGWLITGQLGPHAIRQEVTRSRPR